ncbi:PLDc N-terminal domain-containing protein [Terrabacter sp. 2YAF2]|uniref:PLDc N-terminal domain-containing protein n=1 Tax=Terrabacter sp. 2YAF2 TaxID=3233026 RepID=UPI003F957894
MAKKKWSDLTSGQQAAIVVAGCVQVSLAAAAWADLARRPAEEVVGSKAKWAAVIAINFVGPLAYFARGRRVTAPVPLS